MEGFFWALLRGLFAIVLLLLLMWHSYAIFRHDVGNWHLHKLYIVPIWARLGLLIPLVVLLITTRWSEWLAIKLLLLFLYFAQFQNYTIDYFGQETLYEERRTFPYIFKRVTACQERGRWNFFFVLPNGMRFFDQSAPRALDGEPCAKANRLYIFSLPYLVDYAPYEVIGKEYDQYGMWIDQQLNLPGNIDAVFEDNPSGN